MMYVFLLWLGVARGQSASSRESQVLQSMIGLLFIIIFDLIPILVPLISELTAHSAPNIHSGKIALLHVTLAADCLKLKSLIIFQFLS